MKYLVIHRADRVSMEVEASCPARAVDLTPWPWLTVEVRLMGEDEIERHLDGRRVEE